MKDPNLYINPNGENNRKAKANLLIDILLITAMVIAMIATFRYM